MSEQIALSFYVTRKYGEGISQTRAALVDKLKHHDPAAICLFGRKSIVFPYESVCVIGDSKNFPVFALALMNAKGITRVAVRNPNGVLKPAVMMEERTPDMIAARDRAYLKTFEVLQALQS